MNRHDPLKVFIEDGVLTIRIGVDCLAIAVKLNPELTDFDQNGKWVEPEITDADAFAIEVMRELVAESEDGSTLVHLAFDTAAMNAIENGAEGIKLGSDDRQSTPSLTSPVETP